MTTEALVRTPATEDEFALVESHDDAQIIKAMTTAGIIETMVYHFKNSKGQDYYDLSWWGVKMAAQLAGNIHTKMEHEPIIQEGMFIATYSAIDLSRNVRLHGGAQQDLKLQSGKMDNQAYAKVTSKAQRNAIKHTLMQVPLYQQLLKFYVQHERMKEEDMLRIIIPENIDKYRFDYNKVLDYCNEQFNKETLDEMELEELKKLSSVLVTKQGKDLFAVIKGE